MGYLYMLTQVIFIFNFFSTIYIETVRHLQNGATDNKGGTSPLTPSSTFIHEYPHISPSFETLSSYRLSRRFIVRPGYPRLGDE